MSATPDILELRGLCVGFDAVGGHVNVIDGASLTLRRGETLALVGESGCGKSLLSLALLGLIDAPGRVSAGQLRFDGMALDLRRADALEGLRGKRIGMVFQEPMSALNPVFTVGAQIIESLVQHGLATPADARARAVAWLERVGLADPQHNVDAYPHQLSGGMKQRVMIAMALAPEPEVLIADEPTTALDVTVQGQILNLLAQLKREQQLAMLLVTHDLGLVGRYADTAAIMYAGRMVEHAPAAVLLEHARHPYTRALLACRPAAVAPGELLPAIAGTVPRPGSFVAGCRFAPRCPGALAHCSDAAPAFVEVEPGHHNACWLDEGPA